MRDALLLQEELDLLPFQDVSIGDQQRALQCQTQEGQKRVRGAFVSILYVPFLTHIAFTRDKTLHWA